jgi:hypothetical protein
LQLDLYGISWHGIIVSSYETEYRGVRGVSSLGKGQFYYLGCVVIWSLG